MYDRENRWERAIESTAGFFGDNKGACTHVCVMLMPAMINKRSSDRSVEERWQQFVSATSACVHASVHISRPSSTSFKLQCSKNALIFCSLFLMFFVNMFWPWQLTFSFAMSCVDVSAFKSVNMVTTEQLDLMTDSVSVDS